jgi:hypothetical protein
MNGMLTDDYFQTLWTGSIGHKDNLQPLEKSAHRSFTSAIVFTTEWCQMVRHLQRHGRACSSYSRNTHSCCAASCAGVVSGKHGVLLEGGALIDIASA